MALFTDGNFVTQADLASIDAEAFAVADAHDMLLPDLITRTIGEAVLEITSRVQSSGGIYASSGISSHHLAAVLNTGGSGSINLPYFRMSNVVVSSPYRGLQSIVKRWVEFKVLVNLYRSALNRTVNDRFQSKYQQFSADADVAWNKIQDCGIPVVRSPLPCPGATMEPNTGSWSVSQTAGAGTSGTYFVVITYTGAAYVSASEKGNAESGPSVGLSLATTGTNVLVIDITNLNPPTGMPASLGTADGITTYMPATGWNVYVGSVDTELRLQNSTPIPIATKTYTLAAAPTTSGALLEDGQYPDVNFAIGAGRLFRG